MSNRLDETLDGIKTKKDFIMFVNLLKEDYTINQAEWENPSIDMFLDAMAVWTEHIERYYKNCDEEIPKNIPWKIFANILLASKIYE